MIREPHSLQNRLLATVLGTVVGVWLATALFTWQDVRHELDELLDSHLAQAAAILVVQAQEVNDDDGTDMDAPSLHPYAPKVVFQIFHQDRLMMRSASAPLMPLVGNGKEFKAGFANVQIADVAWRVFAASGAEKDVHIYVGEEVGSRTSILSAVLRGTLLPMAVALPLLALALWLGVRRSLQPLRKLSLALTRRQPEALQSLELDGVPSEMAPMVDALNSLFDRIGVLLESERRFTADASHELRTPIAAIRAQAQVALGASDDPARSTALHNTLLGCDRAIHLVEQLLTLSRLEASATPVMSALDLTSLTRRAVALVAPSAITKGQILEFDGPAPCTLDGNEALLSILVRNLLDNAVRYSPQGARIHVAVAHLNGRTTLRVEDSGPGLSDTDLAHLGERFFRVPGTTQTGSGLGWSIVRRVAAVHRLEPRVTRSQTLGGLSVSVNSLLI